MKEKRLNIGMKTLLPAIQDFANLDAQNELSSLIQLSPLEYYLETGGNLAEIED